MTEKRMVKVIYGPNDDRLPITGYLVGAVRNSLLDAFNIPSQALALVNGVQVEPSYMLQVNDTLEFCKQNGNKGRRKMFTKAEILQEYTDYPDDVMDELFTTLRHDDVSANGQPIWHEFNVDKWLDARYPRKRVDDGRDKVIPPNSVRIAGVEYTDLTSQDWRLLQRLLRSPRRTVKTGKVIEHLYGHDAECKENALTQVIKRINEKLGKKKCPCIVSEGNGFVTITR